MNIKKETQSKLDYYKKDLEDYQNIYKERGSEFSESERIYFDSKIKSIRHNIKYFEQILNILEDKNE